MSRLERPSGTGGWGSMTRLFFRTVAGRQVFYPYGAIGPGYLLSSKWAPRVARFLRLWVAALAAAVLGHAYLHVRLEVDDSLLVATGTYLLLIAIYVVRVTLYTRRLKIVPRQVHVTAL